MSEENEKNDLSYTVDDLVEAKASGWTKFYRGKIIKVNKDDDKDITYDIQFDDGEKKTGLKANQIKKAIEEDKEEETVNVLEEVMAFCRSRQFLKIFEDYIISHIKYFKDIEFHDKLTVMRLEWITQYEEYLDLFNNTLATKFEELGVNKDDFFKELSDADEGNRLSPEERHFMTLMRASADMADWIRIMTREARYYYQTGMSHFGYVPPEAVKNDVEYVDPRFAK